MSDYTLRCLLCNVLRNSQRLVREVLLPISVFLVRAGNPVGVRVVLRRLQEVCIFFLPRENLPQFVGWVICTCASLQVSFAEEKSPFEENRTQFP